MQVIKITFFSSNFSLEEGMIVILLTHSLSSFFSGKRDLIYCNMNTSRSLSFISSEITVTIPSILFTDKIPRKSMQCQLMSFNYESILFIQTCMTIKVRQKPLIVILKYVLSTDECVTSAILDNVAQWSQLLL